MPQDGEKRTTSKGVPVVYSASQGKWVADGAPPQWPAGTIQLPNGEMVAPNSRGGLTKLGSAEVDMGEAGGRNFGFASRQQIAEGQYQKALADGYRPTSWVNNTANFITDLPDGGVLNPLANALRDEPSRRGFIAERTFAVPSMRKDTGAAYRDSELRDIVNQQFPAAFADSQDAVKDRRQTRQSFYAGSRASSGLGSRQLPQTLPAAAGSLQMPYNYTNENDMKKLPIGSYIRARNGAIVQRVAGGYNPVNAPQRNQRPSRPQAPRNAPARAPAQNRRNPMYDKYGLE